MRNGRSGFTLVELMVAVSILVTVWGSVGLILRKTSIIMKDVVSETRGGVRSRLARMEKDLGSVFDGLIGEKMRVFFDTPSTHIIYEIRQGRIWRLNRQGDPAQDEWRMLSSGIERGQWRYYFDGKWLNEWKENHLPQALCLSLVVDGESFEIPFPIRVV